ncbi:hypothetical protein [Polyangium sp. 6x1]|nr:hypothetical protein [Polyangium sp. 6x1]MDI1447608.1 hypothetical protein [Polyangium sp. 6x1]
MSEKTTSKTDQTRWMAERRLERRDAVGGIVVARRKARAKPQPK